MIEGVCMLWAYDFESEGIVVDDLPRDGRCVTDVWF